MSAPDRVGVLVGGGPAPGINDLLAAITSEAEHNGLQVFGFIEGFKYLMENDATKYIELTIANTSDYLTNNASYIRTSRENPARDSQALQNTVAVLRQLNIKYLITIGGFYTVSSTKAVSDASGIKCCFIPKTIDNDLPLPIGMPTFGHQTAKDFGSSIIFNMLEDAKTIQRFFIVVTSGRTTGHLALGIGKPAGAQLTLIPEEFKNKKGFNFKYLIDVIEGSIIKRVSQGKDHGVIILAEGILEALPKEDIKQMYGSNIKYDPHGHILFSEIDFGRTVRDEIRKRVEARKLGVTFTEKHLGYELRCAPPNAYDCEYARDLGFGAVKFLLSGGSDAMIMFEGGSMKPKSFKDLIDITSGKARIRSVDIDSEGYACAVSYMIRLKPDDFSDEKKLNKLAETVKVSPEEFKKEFHYIVQ
jgi:6-phosphofructokinase